MRISLSKKILFVYGLFLVFSLIQGCLLYLVIEQFRSYTILKELILTFKSQVHTLEEHKNTISFVFSGHKENKESNQKADPCKPFEDDHKNTLNVLRQLDSFSGSKQSVGLASHLENIGFFLTNYRRAYFELHDLLENEQVLHAKGSFAFSQLPSRFPELEPDVGEQLFFLMTHYFINNNNIFANHNLVSLSRLKDLKSKLGMVMKDQKTMTIIEDIIVMAEEDYLNSLAIVDRQQFLTDSAEHLTHFCDSFASSLTDRIEVYRYRLKWYMFSLVSAAILLTLFLFWWTRRYFKRFLANQQNAIRSIGSGNYDYSVSTLPEDELGDLAKFMKEMAGTLKHNVEVINRNEKHVRLLLNSAAEAIYGLDIEGRCTFCNNSFLRILKYESRKEILGRNIHEMIHHTRIDGSDYPWDECMGHRGFLEGRETHSDSELFWKSDGSSFYAECWSHPIRENGDVIGAVVTFLDITQRREALLALRNSEELYRTLIENIDLGITLIDKNLTVIMTNSAQGRMFDRPSESFKGLKCYREFEKRDQICSHCPGIRAIESGKVHEEIVHSVKNDGTNFTVRIKAFPVYKEEIEPWGFIEVVEDVTEKLAAEQNLAAEKERLAVTLRSIGDGVITTDVNGRVVLLNKVAEQLCGWNHEEANGKPLAEVFQIFNEDTGAPAENPVDKVLATGQIVALANHTALVARDGTRRSIADSGAAIRDRESNIIGVVLVFRDVTEEKIREKELLKAKKLESISILAGGIAHDFNNILSAILGNINLVRHIVSPEELKAQSFLEEAEKASLRAQNLTHQLLTFSKGGEPIKRVSSLVDIIDDSTAFVLRGTKIKYQKEIPEDIWHVDVDPGQISQVIQNIVLNARQAMPNGGNLIIGCKNVSPEEIKTVALNNTKKFVKVTVTDTGNGIPPQYLDTIFDPYFTTKNEGNGLGLSICHSIIEKHHGLISVESEQDAGTTFTFYLPASTEQTVEQQYVDHHEKVYDKANLTVLLMDDDEQIRDIGDAMLVHLGCNTLQAVDGSEAVKIYTLSQRQDKPIDLVIMDLTIPGGMGGKEAVAEILKLNPQARVIVSSGYSNDPIMANYRKYGFCGSIIKPYRLKELAQAIDKAMAL